MFMHQTPQPALAQRLTARLKVLLTKKDFEFLELLGGSIGTSWGLWLLMPWPTFAAARSFDAMREMAPEWLWGLVILLAGAAQLVGLLLDHWRGRRAGALALAAIWMFIGTMIGIASPTSTGVVVYPWLSLASLWAYWRMRLVG